MDIIHVFLIAILEELRGSTVVGVGDRGFSGSLSSLSVCSQHEWSLFLASTVNRGFEATSVH